MGLKKLYIIGTPLGNLEDITLRAQKHLKELRHLFAEDTRELSKLLNLLQIPLVDKKLHSYSSHNMKEATDLALKLLEESGEIGLVSDRGMPAISDPGAVLVHAAREAGHTIVPIPGPSAVTTVFAVSGITSTAFHFVGFLPTTHKQRQELWNQVRRWPEPLCFFESPRRMRETAEELAKEFPDSRLFLGREMTKQFEEFTRHSLSELKPESINELGEFTALLIPTAQVALASWEEEVALRVLPDKEWAKAIATRSAIASSDIYNALQKAKGK